MEILLKLLLLFVNTVYAHTDVQVFNDNPVNIQWQEYGEEYEYMVEVYQLRAREERLIYTSDWILENTVEIEIGDESSYLWRVYIKEIGKTCEDEHQCFNVESGYFDFYFPLEIIEKDEELPIEEEVVETLESIEEVDREIPEEVKERVVDTPTDEVITNPEKEVKGVKKEVVVKENSCEYIYNINRESFTLKGCNISYPKIESSTYYTYKDMFVVSSKGSYENMLRVYIKNTVCRNFDLLNPKTWIGCDEVSIDSEEYDVELNYEVYFFKDTVISPTNYIFGATKFEIGRVVESLPSDILVKGSFSLKHRGEWLDQSMGVKIPTTFKKIEDGSSGIYSFPFNRIVHVNQWHGCTAYQCPHKGIDFAASRENIYASGSGVVVSKGYDSYYGECRSGGNYLVVKYDGGHHMAYLHLEKSLVGVNQRVSKGDLIAVSGNSGSYNCQPLGYHLHFELREGRRQSSHINPVPFISVNWDLVKTNMASKFPKRLSGDNPHPRF